METLTFPKSARLKHRLEFRNVLTRGSRYKRRGLVVYCLENENGATSRLGVMISKRVCKRASRRNRMKRLTREWFRADRKSFVAPCDVVVRFVGDTGIQKRQEMIVSMRRLFARSGVLRCNAPKKVGA